MQQIHPTKDQDLVELRCPLGWFNHEGTWIQYSALEGVRKPQFKG